MNKRIQKLMLIVTAFASILTSCAQDNSSSSSDSDIKYNDINFENSLPEIDIKKEEFDPIEIGTKDDPAQEIDVSEIGDRELCTYADVDTDFTLKVISKGAYFTSSSLLNGNIITIEDQSGASVTPSIVSGNDSYSFLVSAENGYEPGEVYTVYLNDNAPLVFSGKNDTVRKVTFSVKRDDVNTSSLKEGIKHYPYSIVHSVDDVDTGNMSMILTSKIEAEKDDIICFDFKDENNNIYIKFISQETISSIGYKVHYTDPDPDDLFNELDLHQGQQQVDMEDDFHINDAETIKKSILNSEFVEEYAAAVAYTYNFSEGWVEFWKSAKINISFNVNSTTLSIKISVTFKHNFEKTGWILMASLTFEYQRTLTVSADAKIKRVLGILPYITMNCSAVADDIITVQFEIIFTKTAWDKDKWEKKDPEDLDWDDAKSAVAVLDQNIGGNQEAETEALGTSVVGPNLSIPLGYISVKLGPTPLSLDVEVFLCANISATIGLGAAYTWHQRQVFIQYSNSNKEETKGSSSPEVTQASSVNAYFFGKLYFEISLKLSLSLYFTGLKKIFRVSIDFSGGIYLSVTGYGELFYNFTNKTFSMDLGANITLGLFIRITLSVVLLNSHSFDFNLYDKKWPLISIGDNERITSFSSDRTLELSKNQTQIDMTNALTFDVFDGSLFKTTAKTYAYNAQRDIVSGLLVQNPIKASVFSSIEVENSQLMTFSDGVLRVNSSAAREFTTNLIVKVKSLTSSEDKTYTLPVHFLLEGSHFVTFDGDTSTKKAYATNDAVSFPIPEEREGYYFYGYTLDDGQTFIDMTSDFLMPNYDVNIKSVYAEKVYYTVTYYDGFGNKIGEETVLNRQPAKGPDAKTRDANMSGYIFLNWDIDLSSVTSDVSAYGVYVKVEE